MYKTNTYTTYNVNLTLTYICNYVTLLILALFIQANSTNTYTTYNINIILTFTLHYSFFFIFT